MYLRQLTSDGSSFVHSATSIRLTPHDPPSLWLDRWILRIEELLALNEVTLSKRVVFTPGEGITVLLQVLAPARLENQLRDIFTYINAPPGPKSLMVLPQNDTDLQRLLDEAPALCSPVVIPRFSAGHLWFACPFRVTNVWSRVVSLAEAPVGYQVNLYPHICSSAMLRAMKRNLDKMKEHLGVSPTMMWLQAQIVDRARRARWLQEDLLLATTSRDGMLWVRQVETEFGSLHAEFGGAPELRFTLDDWHDSLALACAFDEGLAADPSYLGSQVQDIENGKMQLALDEDLLGISIPAVPNTSVNCGPGRITSLTLGSANTAIGTANDAVGSHIFLSYAHADSADMRRVRNQLHSAGLEVWVDERLEGGQEWDTVIEERIRSCALLIALISPDAAASRWVRRELKFADSLGKPLTCVRLRETALSDGLGLLLQTLQWIDASQPDADDRLLRSARLCFAQSSNITLSP